MSQDNLHRRADDAKQIAADQKACLQRIDAEIYHRNVEPSLRARAALRLPLSDDGLLGFHSESMRKSLDLVVNLMGRRTRQMLESELLVRKKVARRGMVASWSLYCVARCVIRCGKRFAKDYRRKLRQEIVTL